MPNELTLLPSDPLAAITQAIQTDPRLKSAHTQRQYDHRLRQFERWRHGRPLTKTLVEAYAAELQTAGLAPSTVNQSLAAIRWWARKVSDLAADHGSDALADRIGKQSARVITVRDVSGARLPPGRLMAQTEINALLEACDRDHTPAGARDAALLALYWATGLRCAEALTLTLDDIQETAPGKAALSVHGKGDKDDETTLTNGGYTRLRLWLDRYRGDAPGRVFCPITRGGHSKPEKRISTAAARKILARRLDQAGITKPTTFHDFRRTFASQLLQAGHDIATVQKAMRHSSITTTVLYDRRPQELVAHAIETTIEIPV